MSLNLLCESGGCGRTGTIHYRNRWLCRRCVEELDGQLYPVGHLLAGWAGMGTLLFVLVFAVPAWVTDRATPQPISFGGMWALALTGGVLLAGAAWLKGRQ